MIHELLLYTDKKDHDGNMQKLYVSGSEEIEAVKRLTLLGKNEVTFGDKRLTVYSDKRNYEKGTRQTVIMVEDV